MWDSTICIIVFFFVLTQPQLMSYYTLQSRHCCWLLSCHHRMFHLTNVHQSCFGFIAIRSASIMSPTVAEYFVCLCISIIFLKRPPIEYIAHKYLIDQVVTCKSWFGYLIISAKYFDRWYSAEFSMSCSRINLFEMVWNAITSPSKMDSALKIGWGGGLYCCRVTWFRHNRHWRKSVRWCWFLLWNEDWRSHHTKHANLWVSTHECMATSATSGTIRSGCTLH